MEPDSPPLEASFANGWRSLPTELKCEVLSYILPRGATVASGFLHDCVQRDPNVDNIGRWDNRPLSDLITIPDFTGVAMDLILAHNTIHIYAECDKKEWPALCNRVQNVKISVDTLWYHWKWLAEFATSALAGRRLNSVELVIDGARAYEHRAQLFVEEIELTAPITVRTRRLKLSSDNWDDRDGRKELADTERLTELIKRNLIKDDR